MTLSGLFQYPGRVIYVGTVLDLWILHVSGTHCINMYSVSAQMYMCVHVHVHVHVHDQSSTCIWEVRQSPKADSEKN